ncbi:MAG TPA: hypothetical protein DDZ51_13250 [Planctomycetaceae bacterium]|nr:hypothetical protein [Planctomycetaceae bacterium]
MQGNALAHPGHGITHGGDTPAHYLLEPSHGISVWIVIAAALAARFIISRALASHKPTSN